MFLSVFRRSIWVYPLKAKRLPDSAPESWQARKKLNGLSFSHMWVFSLLKYGSPLKFTLKRFGIFAWKMVVLNHCVDLHELHELIYILAKITPRPPFMLIQKRCGNWVVYIPQFYFMQICFYEIFQLASIWIKAFQKI